MSGMNFLSKYCSLLENTEVPPRFAIWTGIATLLAMLERRVWIPQGIFTVYPNFYFVLVAASGQKKSTAIDLAADLLRKTDPGPKIIAQKVTPEALIEAMKVKNTRNSKKLLAETYGGIVVADELITFLNKKTYDNGLGGLLTQFFDCKEKFEYVTIGRGEIQLNNSYLSILGGSTVDLLREAIPFAAIGGGLTSRMLFIYDDSTPPPVPWVDHDENINRVKEELVKYLQELTQLEGPIKITPEAREAFEIDYRQFYKSELRQEPSLAGYSNRRGIHLLKISIAMMIAENPAMTLEDHHIKKAIFFIHQLEENLTRVVELITSSDTGSEVTQVLSWLNRQPEGLTSKVELQRKFQSKFNAQDLAKIMATLIDGGMVEADTSKGKLIYKATKRK